MGWDNSRGDSLASAARQRWRRGLFGNYGAKLHAELRAHLGKTKEGIAVIDHAWIRRELVTTGDIDEANKEFAALSAAAHAAFSAGDWAEYLGLVRPEHVWRVLRSMRREVRPDDQTILDLIRKAWPEACEGAGIELLDALLYSLSPELRMTEAECGTLYSAVTTESSDGGVARMIAALRPRWFRSEEAAMARLSVVEGAMLSRAEAEGKEWTATQWIVKTTSPVRHAFLMSEDEAAVIADTVRGEAHIAQTDRQIYASLLAYIEG